MSIAVEMASRSRLFVLILLFQVFQINAQIRNVAFNKPTNQSSTYSDDLASDAVSARAVDGNTNGDYNTGKSCTHTQPGSPGWWCVDLQQVLNIINIKIYNRINNQDRLQGFEIKLRSDGQCNGQGFGSATTCYKDTETVQDIYSIDRCNQPPSTALSARTVFIGVTDILTLCEVEIDTGVCPKQYYGVDCKNLCNCKDRVCDATSGICNGECIDGYWGNLCQQQCSNNCNNGGCRQGDGYCYNGCKVGWYDTKCQQQCSNNCNNGGCERVNGYCNNGCKVGWYGGKCDTPCNQQCSGCSRTGVCNGCINGRYGTNCELQCSNGCKNNICTKAYGHCTCKTNFSGYKCVTCVQGRYGADCELYCSNGCKNNICNKDNGHCTCKTNFSGYKCVTCVQGRYGADCELYCSNGCKNNICNKDNGHCTCKTNFSGYKCDSCAPGRYGTHCDIFCSNGCKNNICNKDNGHCTCKTNFSGYKCDSCIHGRYGTNCQETCSNGCQNDICKKYYGHCTCKVGYSGTKCDSCKLGKYGTNCQQSCSDGCRNNDCSRYTGNCTHGCNRGRFSSNCGLKCMVTNCNGNCDSITGTCTSCTRGYYGTNCQSSCNDGCSNSQCYKDNGDCRYSCIRGRYSPNCGSRCLIDKCVGNCYRKTGQCSSCVTGWFGTNCETRCSSNCTGECNKSTGRCTECKPGIFGNDCNKPCPVNCLDTCTRNDGKCNRCKPNTVGLYCKSTCGTECQPITDGTQETCDRDGRCTECIVGGYGDRCDKNCSTTCNGTCERYDGRCDRCITGTHGDTCHRNCSTTCKDGCDRTSASCNSCFEGISGDTCDKKCTENCTVCNQYDINNCSQCKDGKYHGTSCNYPCSSNCKHSLCSQMDGTCSVGCVEGKTGHYCSENCTWGFYGENCNRTCGNCAQNTTCEITRGSCGLVGCMEGYTGDTCQEEKNPDSTVAIPVVASVIVVIIVVLLIVVGVVVMFRRNKRNGNKPVPASEDNEYENFNLKKSVVKYIPPEQVIDNGESSHVNDARSDVNDASPGVYENFQIARSKTCIDLKDLWKTIQTKKQDESFKPEYQQLPKDLCSPVDVCLNDVNRPKNRYMNICAFDHTRVKLDIENDDPTSDYVNACYITGYGNVKHKYIASQGPNDVNINEFVRMLWDVKTGKIAMVTNLQEACTMKCLKYWPSSGKVKIFRKIKIELIEEDILAHFTIRTLKISKDECGSRTIKQYHYTSWPDKGVPIDMASLVEFRNKVKKSRTRHTGPLVVHCSAGIGRTGTFLALDYLIDEGKAEGSVDVFKCVSRMRRERVNMVQTNDQYVFLHEAILEWYIAGDTTTTVTDYQGVYQDLLKVKQSSGKCQLAEKFEMMGQVCPKYTDADYSTALLKENQNKNRIGVTLAYEKARPYLSITAPNTADYINAVYIPSYRKKRAYILTQTPLPNTVIDFWRMVVETESQTIVQMDYGQDKTKDVGRYLPGDKPLTYEPFTITKKEEIEHEFYTIITCQVTGTSQDSNLNQTVRIYQCTFWKGQDTTPKSSTPFFTLLEHIHSWTCDQRENPIIVHCLTGVDKGGLFCVLAAILERLTIEQDVSVLQTIIQLRVSRPQIVTCYQQVKFCFDSIGNYLDHFSMYANAC